MGTIGVDVRGAKIDGPKGYDPADLDPNAGGVAEDDSVGSTFDDDAAGKGKVLDVPDDAEDDLGAAGGFMDAGGGEVEDSGVGEMSGLAAGADVGTRTGISEVVD